MSKTLSHGLERERWLERVEWTLEPQSDMQERAREMAKMKERVVWECVCVCEREREEGRCERKRDLNFIKILLPSFHWIYHNIIRDIAIFWCKIL